jgi:hypothetical protein
MPGWDSLQTVTAVHNAFQLVGLVLLAVGAALAGFLAYQLRTRTWPEWLDVGQYQLRSRFFAIGCAAVLALLGVSEVVAYGYGLRQQTLMAEAEQASAERIKRLAAETKPRPVTDAPARYLKENSDLLQKLTDAENKLAELERAQSHKRLSQEQRRFLIEALRPFAGQKVSIASIRGDDDGEVLAQDFVSVFDAAGWDHHGEAGVTTQDWPRDPVGIEVVLNEDDARKDKIADGIVALINTVRQLGMVYDSTIYMDNDVPEGQALLKVGKKLRK